MNALVLTLCLLPAADPQPQARDWAIDGVKREALVVAPAKSDGAPPLVFAFHSRRST
jgi:hypothetical protein